jgi:hypothetical protein
MKPLPKKNDRCDGCSTIQPLLIPVGYAPGFPCIAYSFYCFDCRLQLKNDNDTRYCWFVEDMIHDKSEIARTAFDEWKDISPDILINED